MGFLRAALGTGGLFSGAGLSLVALALSTALAGSGCAAERDPINRVQLGALPKQFFVGEKLEDASDDPEFYFRTTVVDVSAGAGSESLFTSSDSQPTVRIRWEIAEKQLIARLTYELVDGTDGKGTQGPNVTPRADEPRGPKAPGRTTTDGQIVAAFEIQKQFDIRADYNALTGEENNVIVENDGDRPWNQREWIRVDWSKNLITDAYDLDAVSQMGLYGGVKWTPVAVNVQDPNDPDAPVVELDKGYFDVVNKAFASPQIIHDEEWGDFPACMLLGEFPRTSCNPSEVKMRLSFKKVEDTDYEPLDYDGNRMQMFGLFSNDRFGYDRRYGVVDQQWHRFASRWNIWEKSHATPAVACGTASSTPPGADPHRDANGDGTEDECAAVGQGSRCDVFSKKCTMPIRDRKVKPVVWHVNRDYPEDLFEIGQKVVSEWNDTLRVAVLSARLAECRRTKEAGCEQAMGWPARWADDFVPPAGDTSLAEVPDVFVLCHNPVDATKDAPACGKDGTSPRMGDLRYNLFTFVASAQVQAPWGIMVDAEDPLTGEKIAGSVNQYGATLDRAAASVVDIVALLNGVTSPQQFIEGKDVAAWVSAQNAKAGKTAPVSAEELAARLGAFRPSALAPFATGAAKKTPRSAPKAARLAQRMRDLAAAGKLGAGDAVISQRLSRLRGTDLEAQLVTPEVAQRAGFDPRTAQSLTKDALARATPVGRTMPFARRALEKRGLVSRAQRHACRREAPEPDNLLGVAREAQRLFGKPDAADPGKVSAWKDEVFAWARKRFARGVFSHEMGHSLGLRHNFAGTFDALNYDLGYWQLRTKNGSVTKACTPGNTDGASCVGPRYVDPVTEEEVNGSIGSFASSSVMDYPGDQALDSFAMGAYDKAAVRFAYGGVVDVWAAPGLSVNAVGDGKRKAFELLAFTDAPGLFGVQSMWQPGTTDVKYLHYSQYAAEFGLLEGCRPDKDAPLGTRCFGPPMDVVDYRDLGDYAAVPEYADFATQKKVVDKQGRVRRGYLFSSDEYADSGNVPSFTYDAGADAYEQVRFLETAYENRYILEAFRRGRTMFNSDGVVFRTQRHYLDTMQLLAKTFAFAMVLEVDDPSKPDPKLLVDGNYGPLAAAASHAFDVFTHALVRPEPGAYCSTENENCPGLQPFGLSEFIHVADPYAKAGDATYPFQVALGQGRYVHNDYDYGQGYWWGDYQKQVGSFYDKVWATYYLSEAYDSFISNSKEDFLDGRYKNVSFATIYPEQVRRLYASLMTGDMTVYAPWVGSTAPGKDFPSGDPTYPDFYRADGLGTRPASAKLLDPAFGWQQQLYAMVWGTVFFPTSWTNQFLDDARITVRAGDALGWPVAETYTFVDPVTSITYRAHTTGTEKLYGVDHQKAIGARMLEWANELLTSAYVPQTDNAGNILLNADGTPKLVLVNGKPKVNPDYPGADAALRRYVMNLEVMRQLVSTYVREVDQPLP